ncbi:hypothetical protein HN014_11055 [Aquimarina sp. TRL1]|uniref:hypothetical protein n=1 Tax=Aquimarina sp. (strain TRL1) TaxID=2736252 RepID=UPI00158F29F9|nr:hypothetical protein [Aquimarina sp. TRL1]QKX05430.1 hypothetical protein HN014_11055 [Aquimarina sp. TRL1]
MTHELAHTIGFQHSDQSQIYFMKNGGIKRAYNWTGMRLQDKAAITAQFPDVTARLEFHP